MTMTIHFSLKPNANYIKFDKSYVYYYDQPYKHLSMILKLLLNSHKNVSPSSAASKPIVLIISLSVVLLMLPSSLYSSIAYAQNELQLPSSRDNSLVPSDSRIGSNGNNPLVGLDFLKSSGIFNGSSLIIAAGISTVNGVKVTGVNLPDNNSLSVTLVGNKQNTSSLAIPPSSVSVIALRIALSHDDLTSLMTVAAESSKSESGFMNSLGAQQGSGNASSAGYVLPPEPNNATDFNPLNFLKNIQIGSTSLVNPDWKIPHIVRMGFFGNRALTTPIADLVLIEVIPYIGEPGAPAGPTMP